MPCHHAASAGLPRSVNHFRQLSCCHQVRQDFVAPPAVRAVLTPSAKISLSAPAGVLAMDLSYPPASGFLSAPFEPPRA